MGGKASGKGDGKDMKPGDWICPDCGDLVFAKNDACRMCSSGGRPGSCGGGKGKGKPGDWTCTSCGNLNFSKNTECRQCQEPMGNAQRHGIKPGDWICAGCG